MLGVAGSKVSFMGPDLSCTSVSLCITREGWDSLCLLWFASLRAQAALLFVLTEPRWYLQRFPAALPCIHRRWVNIDRACERAARIPRQTAP